MFQRKSVPLYPYSASDSEVPLSIIQDATHQAPLGTRSIRGLTSSDNAFNPSPYTQHHIRSISSQSVTIPCSIGYLILSSPLYSCARRPIKRSSCNAPAITRVCFGRPTLTWALFQDRDSRGILTKRGCNMMVVLHLRNQLWSSRIPVSLAHSRFREDMKYIVNDDRLIC